MSGGSKSARNAPKSSLEAAAEAAAKVNAMLIAKGKLKLPAVTSKAQHVSSTNSANTRNQSDLFTAEVEINEAPVASRNLLTKGHTQDEINKKSGAAISTRGRYMTYEDMLQNSRERPLYLHVQASNRDAVEKAVQCIQDIVHKHLDIVNISPGNQSKFLKFNSDPGGFVAQTQQMAPPAQLPPPPPPTTATIYHHEKVYVGLEHAPPNFPLKDKIIGPGLTYLSHISTETGAVVQLLGKGSGSLESAAEPLHIHLTHTNPEQMKEAKALALNLVQTVQSEFAQWQQQQLALATLALQNHALSVQVAAAAVPVSLQTLARVQPSLVQVGVPQVAPTQVTGAGHLTLAVPPPTSTILTPTVALPISAASMMPQTILAPQQTLAPYSVQTSQVVVPPTSAASLVAVTPTAYHLPPPQYQTQEVDPRIFVTAPPPPQQLVAASHPQQSVVHHQHPDTIVATQVVQSHQVPPHFQTHITYHQQPPATVPQHQLQDPTKYLIATSAPQPQMLRPKTVTVPCIPIAPHIDRVAAGGDDLRDEPDAKRFRSHFSLMQAGPPIKTSGNGFVQKLEPLSDSDQKRLQFHHPPPPLSEVATSSAAPPMFAQHQPQPPPLYTLAQSLPISVSTYLTATSDSQGRLVYAEAPHQVRLHQAAVAANKPPLCHAYPAPGGGFWYQQ